MKERANRLAQMVLTGSDRITKAMRKEALQLMEDIRADEASMTFDTALGHVTISNEDVVKSRDLIAGGRTIQAIKDARWKYSLGLHEAKALMDEIRNRYNIKRA